MVKNPPANAGKASRIPGSGISPGGGNDNPLQCSCLENAMDRGAWWAIVHGVTKSRTRQKQLSSVSFCLKHFSVSGLHPGTTLHLVTHFIFKELSH